jgi:hypothetical protein
VAFVRSNPDPLRIVFFVVGLAAWLIWSALRKVLQGGGSPPQSAKSFRFSEITPDPNYPHVRTIRTKILGVSHKNPCGTSRQQIIRNFCRAGDALFLVREPENPADRNAVLIGRVCQGTDGAIRGEQIGYLSLELARDLAPILDQGGVVMFAEVLELTGDLTGEDGGNVGVNIRVEEYIRTARPVSLASALRPGA